MNDLVEQQREHFNRISATYFAARKHPNHLLLKDLIWSEFFKRNSGLHSEVNRVLEPMCGSAEGYAILTGHLDKEIDYSGFDYSESMVEFAKSLHPSLKIGWGDVTSFKADGEAYDLIILIGGLHHVFSRTQEVIQNLTLALRPGGFFLNFEPTHNNWLSRYARQRIYERNDLFDQDTEQGFEYSDLQNHFVAAGYDKVDEVYPGLLAYVLYYNPDAFPALNVGNQALVKAAFWFDRLLWANWIGRKLSFATIGLWQRQA